MPRVLVVATAYRPAMLADMHRARMLAWTLPALGWDVEILAPDAAEVRQDAVDPDADDFFAPAVPVHAVRARARWLFEALGSRSLAWRTLIPAHNAGARLLRARHFDLVYLSTTTFNYFLLGPAWRRRFGVPYVLDYHDPWATSPRARARDRFMERLCVASAAGIVAVSPAYLGSLQAHYGNVRSAWAAPGRNAVIPFAAREEDLALAAASPERRAGDGEISLVYVGAGGPIMARSFALLCGTFAALRASGNPQVERVRLRLYGTTYGWREGERKPLEDIARDCGVGGLVSEDPRRVSYRRSLQLLLASDGAVVLGVDDAAYMPSKLFTYALSGKPLLASLRQESPAAEHFGRGGALGHLVTFDASAQMPREQACAAMAAFLDEAAARPPIDRRSLLKPWLAHAMARAHVRLFEACLNVGAGTMR